MSSLCDNLNGIEKDCLVNIGGTQNIYIADRDDLDSVTVSAGTVTAITMASGASFHEFAFTRDSSSFTETPEVDVTNGSTLFAQNVTLTVKRRDVSKRNAIMLLAAGQRDLAVIIKDNNGNYELAGYNSNFSQGLQLTGGEGGSGTAKTDLNGYTIELTNSMPEMAFAVDDSIIAGLL
jgi:hypothetical protein